MSGDKVEGETADGASEDLFGLQKMFSTSSTADRTLDVDPSTVDESNLSFAFRMLKTERDAKRAKS